MICNPFAQDRSYSRGMKSVLRVFVDHPASVGETWGQHAFSAWGFAWRLQIAAVAALVHAIFPFLFVRTASVLVTRLHDRMVTHRVRSVPASTGETASHQPG